MMKRCIALLAVGVFYSINSFAGSYTPVECKGNSGYYARLDVGSSWYGGFKENGEYKKSKIKPQAVYNVGLGRKVWRDIRADINFQFRNVLYKEQGDKQSIDNYAIFLNGYYDFVNRTRITPYVTAGVGYSRVVAGNLRIADTQASYEGRTTHKIGLNIGLGIRTELIKRFSLDVAYKFVCLGKVKTYIKEEPVHPISKQELKSREITLGLVYNL